MYFDNTRNEITGQRVGKMRRTALFLNCYCMIAGPVAVHASAEPVVTPAVKDNSIVLVDGEWSRWVLLHRLQNGAVNSNGWLVY